MVGSVGRLFLAVEIPSGPRDLLAAMLTGATGGARLPGNSVPPANWHLTVRFLGDTSELMFDKLLAELDQRPLGKSFRVELSGLGCFPDGGRASVLWLGVGRGTDELGDLVEVAEEACQDIGLAPNDRPYRPHLTLSRLRPVQDLRWLIDSLVLAPILFEVEELALFRSHLDGGGARYERLESFPL